MGLVFDVAVVVGAFLAAASRRLGDFFKAGVLPVGILRIAQSGEGCVAAGRAPSMHPRCGAS